MDPTLYWFMFPVAIAISTTAILSGIGGGALFTPVFLIVFPLLGAEYTMASAVTAIGAALLTQTFGFASGFIGYQRKGLIDYKSALPFIAVAVPIAILGALLSQSADANLLKGTYAVLMAILSVILLRRPSSVEGTPTISDEAGSAEAGGAHKPRELKARDGTTYRYTAPRQGLGAAATGVGAFLTGMVSVGIGEVIMGQLVKRHRVPLPVAAATSVLIVIATVTAASFTQVMALIAEGGVEAVPWNLVMYTIPGVIIGGQIGPRAQGKVSEATMVRAIALLFALICVAMGWIVIADLTGG
ncbi:MAG: sulfite exporter TauE/SafE family protein [Alphaproteobacteria bacterium]